MEVLILWAIWWGCTIAIGRAEFGRGYLQHSIECGQKKIEWLEQAHTEQEFHTFRQLEYWGDEKKAYWSTHLVWLQKIIKQYIGYEIKTN